MKFETAINGLNKIFEPLNELLCKSCEDNCCRGCGRAGGYFSFRNDDISVRALIQLMQVFKFSHKKGFLGKHGCKLPRGLRSRTCLWVVCPRMMWHLGQAKFRRVEVRVERFINVVQKESIRFRNFTFHDHRGKRTKAL